jgi:hypothetical protein
MTSLTILTPVAPHHLPVLGKCIDSVRMQTVSVEHLTEVDTARLGPGVIRNRLLRQVVTPFVSFLDADDWIEPDFAEKTLAAVGNKYIYTDWYQDGEVVHAPDCAWTSKTFHLVTAVVPTAWVLAVEGFDENLVGMEDSDFYVKMVTRGYCGKRLPIPLVHYRANGGRADTIHTTGTVDKLQAIMAKRYGGLKVACCGNNEARTEKPVGERQPGDVLAQALWGGNRVERGRATGRHYPRTSYPHTCYIDLRDILLSPNLWRQIPDAESEEVAPEPAAQPESVTTISGNSERGLDALASRMGLTAKPKEAARAKQTIRPATPVEYKPDIAKVKRLASKGKLAQYDVYFVRPEKDYPSYADFWRLVELSGYSICSIAYASKHLNNSSYTFIFVTPEETLDCTNAAARTIFWQFEYTGDYTQQKNKETCSELWSSDPYNSSITDAKYVLLGSHPNLREGTHNCAAPKWDIVTLSYLTERRRNVFRFVKRTFATDYPGHSGAQRDEQLSCSRLMLHVNQHDAPALAPIKLALAAAYRLPVVAEAVNDPGQYADKVLFCSYDSLPYMVSLYLDGKFDAEYMDAALYQLLCVEHPFKQCVEMALAQQEVRVMA